MPPHIFVCPPLHSGQKAVAPRFRLLDRDGIANVGDYVLPGDVYINMQVGNGGVGQ